MYPRLTPTLPSFIGDSALLDEPIDVLLLPMASDRPSSSLPLKNKAIKKRKVIEDLTLKIETMDLEKFEFNEVVLRDVVVLYTLVTYFDEGIFRWPKLKRDFYHHIGSDAKRTRIKETHKLGRGSMGS